MFFTPVAYGAKHLWRKVVSTMLMTIVFASPLKAETITIAALGDSLTAGYGLAEEDGFTTQLENWLVARGNDVTVLNAGVSGDTTAGGLARVDWTLTSDVDAVIVELGANDFLRGLPPEEARKNLDGILGKVAARNLPVLLAGIPAPANYGASYKEAFDAIYPELAQAYDALYYPNFLIGLGREIPEIRKRVQSDGLHPNAEGVQLIVEDIGPLVEELLETVNDQRS